LIPAIVSGVATATPSPGGDAAAERRLKQTPEAATNQEKAPESLMHRRLRRQSRLF
jgi:hypothetical protein